MEQQRPIESMDPDALLDEAAEALCEAARQSPEFKAFLRERFLGIALQPKAPTGKQ